MPDIIVADFQVLRDSNLRLEDGESHQLTFDVQGFLHFSTALRNHGLLAFNIRPAERGRLTVRAIGPGPVTIMNRTLFSQSHTRMHQEAFDFDAIVSATNTSIGQNIGSLLIEFRAEDGPLILSDIVIHYKKIIPLD